MGEGGTKMYCPYCENVTECRVVPLSELGEDSDQRKKYLDIRWFRRGRECLECKETFITGELHEDFIDELKILRKIKKKGKMYLNRPDAIKKALNKILSFLE